jgi:copper chaperone CopZ
VSLAEGTIMLRYCWLSGFAFLWPLVACAEEVTLRIDDVPSDDAGQEINRALGDVPGVKVSGKVTKDEPTARVTFDPAKADVGELARAVAGVKTSGREKPSARLVLGYKRSDDTALKDDEVVPRYVEQALAKLKGKGVDGKGWKLDTKNREVHIRLEEKGGAKLADIKSAFPDKKSDALVTFELK